MADAAWLLGYIAFEWDAVDEWYDEAERVEGHLRDPYHRVDIRRSARRVRVTDGNALIAAPEGLHVLAETGLPLRYYLDKGDVRGQLRRSTTTSICPYKGTATYWDVVLPEGREVRDAAWSYETPLENALGVAGRVAFDPDKVDVEERPDSSDAHSAVIVFRTRSVRTLPSGGGRQDRWRKSRTTAKARAATTIPTTPPSTITRPS